MSTIKDVALKAGVSFTTVSHVLNGTRSVSERARAAVHEAVAELGYVPSAVARALKTSATRIVGVIVPNITNPFFAELVRGIEDQCQRSGYAVFLCNIDESGERYVQSLRTLLERRVDGLVIAAGGDHGLVSQTLGQARVPFVIVDRFVPNLLADSVSLDHVEGARAAVGHLLDLGHRRIACISGPAALDVTQARVQGWRSALSQAGVTPDPGWLREGDFSTASGFARAGELLEQTDVTALFACNDLMAMGAIRMAATQGLRVPEDVSIIGFDGIELGGYVSPGLSTVGCSIRHLGEQSVSTLLQRLSQSTAPRQSVTLKPELILRESTAEPSSASRPGPQPEKANAP